MSYLAGLDLCLSVDAGTAKLPYKFIVPRIAYLGRVCDIGGGAGALGRVWGKVARLLAARLHNRLTIEPTYGNSEVSVVLLISLTGSAALGRTIRKLFSRFSPSIASLEHRLWLWNILNHIAIDHKTIATLNDDNNWNWQIHNVNQRDNQ